MKTKKVLSVLLALLMLLSVCICGASAMVIEKPEGFDAFARLHIPQHLHISVEEIDKIAGFFYGTASWDDDELVSECEFYPMLRLGAGLGSSLFRPKSFPFTIIKRSAGGWMAPSKVKDIDPVYDAEDGVCTKEFVIKLLGDDEEIETWNNDGMDEANGVKIGSRLRFSMTAVVEMDGYYGETPESAPVEFTLTEDAVGKTFTAYEGMTNAAGELVSMNLSADTVNYTGSPITPPAVTLTSEMGVEYAEGDDYTLRYFRVVGLNGETAEIEVESDNIVDEGDYFIVATPTRNGVLFGEAKVQFSVVDYTGEFNAYLAEKAAALNTLAKDGDSDASKKLIADAKAAILALGFDTGKSLDENKAAADAAIAAITAQLNNALNAQREADKPKPQTNDEEEKPEGGKKDDKACKWCGEVHQGFLGKIKGLFHSVLYFFAHLFGLK